MRLTTKVTKNTKNAKNVLAGHGQCGANGITGETEKQRRGEKRFDGSACAAGRLASPDRMDPRTGNAHGFVDPSESGGARRFATAVEPSSLRASVALFLLLNRALHQFFVLFVSSW
jgi:hypothetical protein